MENEMENNTSLPRKRRRLSNEAFADDEDFIDEVIWTPTRALQSPTARGLHRPISPPLTRRKSLTVNKQASWSRTTSQAVTATALPPSILPSMLHASQSNLVQDDYSAKPPTAQSPSSASKRRFIRSPIQLTKIEDLSPEQNVDAVALRDLLGDPLIKEAWLFDYLFDLKFVMRHFDPDVRGLVKVKIVHGFWKNEDERRLRLLRMAEAYPNIELFQTYIPDPFGTHHTKMMILFRHDDTAQVIIHTANMIEQDWRNMTQAICSVEVLIHPIGSGERFKVDLLRYLDAYGKRLGKLTEQVKLYDFSTIRAAFLASAPSRQRPATAVAKQYTSFGWLGLQQILSCIPCSTSSSPDLPPHIVSQISSIATLGPTPTWFSHFQAVLAWQASATTTSFSKPSFFSPAKPTPPKPPSHATPKHSIIFPTAAEIRQSLDGYASGGSIHMKLQSVQQQRQLTYLLPLFCHWNPDAAHPKPLSTITTAAQTALHQSQSNPVSDPTLHSPTCHSKAHRTHAAPHIKTYLRFSTSACRTLDWGMISSANLSKQAWGDTLNKRGEVWVQSWEVGVVVWPELFAEHIDTSGEDGGIRAGGGKAKMVPVFGRDMPRDEDVVGVEGAEQDVLVGFRMPYDLPLRSYETDDRPWCATMGYEEEDWMGRVWKGC